MFPKNLYSSSFLVLFSFVYGGMLSLKQDLQVMCDKSISLRFFFLTSTFIVFVAMLTLIFSFYVFIISYVT